MTASHPGTEQGYILQAILESPRDIVIIALDREYRYLAFNEAHRRVMKRIWNVDIRVGQDMLHEVVGRADDRARAKSSFDRALAGEHFVVVEEFGDEALDRRIYEDVYSPITDAAGAVVGLTIYLTDVTEQRRAQEKLAAYGRELEVLVAERTEALRRNEELYRTLVLNAPIAAMVQRAGTILFVNPAAASLLASGHGERLVGHPLTELVAPDIAVRLERGERFTSTEIPLTRADGSIVHVELTTIPVDFEGAAASFSLLVDVTERKRAEREREQLEEQMRHAQKLEGLGVLAGGIAHDFNNLLVGILGNVDGALRRLDVLQVPDETLQSQLQRIKLAATRAAELTSRMLAYAGKGAFALQPLDLSSVAREMTELLGVSLSTSTELAFDLDPRLPAVEGDGAQIRQVVMNLVTNAADAIGDAPGRIVLRTHAVEVDRARIGAMFVADDLEPGQFVCLEVTDSGAGMDARTQASIFDPFFTTKETGRGLGLAAVLGIVRAHHGGLQVTSEPGRGSTFRVFLPPKALDAPLSLMPGEPALDWRPSGVVLIADDQRRVREVLRMMLVDIGFEVIEAVDADTCIAAFRARPDVSLVIVDLMMPGGGGRAVISALRATDMQVPIIISSGFSGEEVGPELRRDARLRFLEKPFDFTTFANAIRSLLG